MKYCYKAKLCHKICLGVMNIKIYCMDSKISTHQENLITVYFTKCTKCQYYIGLLPIFCLWCSLKLSDTIQVQNPLVFFEVTDALSVFFISMVTHYIWLHFVFDQSDCYINIQIKTIKIPKQLHFEYIFDDSVADFLLFRPEF